MTHPGAIVSVPFDAPRLRRLAHVVTSELGIRMPENKLQMLHGRLQRRIHQLGMRSLAEYEQRLVDPVHGKREQLELFDLATTNKTDFFREPKHFGYLVNEALPALAGGRERWNLRLWCAGCSTGQEAYTLAMVLADYAAQRPGFDFSIVATDISNRALAEAEAATYREELVSPVPAALGQRYLMRGKGARAGQVRVVPELRAKLRFKRLNFMDARYDVPRDFDIVFFRNVLIYFDRPTQHRVVATQCTHLKPGGYLFIAHAESLNGLMLPIESLSQSVFRRTR